MPAQVVVLGGGVGGTLTANLLARQLGRDVHVTVVDPTGMHLYQPGFLYAALGKANGRWLARDERTLLRRDVDLAVEAATRIEPDQGRVQLAHGGSLAFDYLVVATGARLVPEEVPGLVEGAHEFYSLEGALRLREALRGFQGGRALVGVAGIPYKCPPAPVEFTLMLDQYLRRHGVRDHAQVTLLSPLNRAFTIESASKLVQPIMERRGIGLETFFNVETVDPRPARSAPWKATPPPTTCWCWSHPTGGKPSSKRPGWATPAAGCRPTGPPCSTGGTSGSSRWGTPPTCPSPRAARPRTSRRRWSPAASPRSSVAPPPRPTTAGG
jgi:hypothetical protein